jgi:hypothetical protein
VSKQSSSFVSAGLEPARTKHNVVSHGVGTSVQLSRGLLGGFARMHSHQGKVVAETLFHVLA